MRMFAHRLLCRVAILAWLCVMPKGELRAHDWYSDLRQPGTGIPCCGMLECRPLQATQIRTVEGGRMQFLLDHEWRDVDPTLILDLPSPDGRVHARWSSYMKRLLCVILPGRL
jgi:hypothetical protein